MRPRPGTLVLLLVLGSAHAVASPGLGASFEWPNWQKLEAAYPDAGAIVLLDETEASFEYLGATDYGERVIRHSAIAILDPHRAAPWLEMDIEDSDYHRVKSVSARTWTGPKQSTAVKKDQFFDVSSFPEFVHFADIRAKRFAFPAIGPHTVVEVRYEYTSTWNFFLEHHFAHTVPTLRSNVRLWVDARLSQAGLEPIVRTYGIESKPTTTHITLPSGEGELYEWGARDLPPIVLEPMMPPPSELVASLRIAEPPFGPTDRSWQNLGRQYYAEYFEPQLEVGAVQDLARQLTAGAGSPAQRVRILYDYVRTRVRYVAVELGVGAIRPHRAGEISTLRYGDCKDKACLLLSLLQGVDIPGCAALVRTHDQGPLDTLLVHSGQFNHMIVWVPLGEDGWWLDPTEEFCPSDYLPLADQGVTALVVGPGVARLQPTPLLPPHSNLYRMSLAAQLESDGSLRGLLDVRANGDHAIRLRRALRSGGANEREAVATEILKDALSGAQMTGMHAADPDSVNQLMQVSIGFTWPRCAVSVGDAMVLPGDFLTARAWESAFEQKVRQHPVIFSGLEQCQVHARITGPPGRRAEAPKPVEEISDLFACSQEAHADSSGLVIERIEELRDTSVSPPDYTQARQRLERFRTAVAEPIHFTPSP